MKLATSTLKKISDNEWIYPISELITSGINVEPIFEYGNFNTGIMCILKFENEIVSVDGFEITEISYEDAVRIITENAVSVNDQITGITLDSNYWLQKLA